jgi:DNA-binding XRE family transcriptional regulator
MTQEQLACIIDRDPRTVMYHENDGQHPSLNIFYQLVTRFDISVDQFFYPDMSADDACKKRINIMLSSMDLRLVEAIIRSIKEAKETEEA